MKFLISVFLGLAVVFSQVGAAHAAPPQQDGTSLTGTVQSVVVETNPESGILTIVVKLLVNGGSQNVRLSVETAAGLGLVVVDDAGNPVLDEEGNPTVDHSIIETDLEIDPTIIIPDDTPLEEKQHPVGAKITEFFSNLFDVDYDMVMSSHSDGFGFGMIAQALWITQKLGGDATLFQTILDGRTSGDYSLVELPDGTIPQSWGQLRKAILLGDDWNSLGDITPGGVTETGIPGNGNGSGKPENPGNGNGNKPANPSGQDKDNPGNGKTK